MTVISKYGTIPNISVIARYKPKCPYFNFFCIDKDTVLIKIKCLCMNKASQERHTNENFVYFDEYIYAQYRMFPKTRMFVQVYEYDSCL